MHKHLFGFESLNDFIQTVFGLRYKYLLIVDVAIAIISSLLIKLVAGVEYWLWSPFWTLVLYSLIILSDFVAGIAVGVYVKKEGFKTQKAMRVFAVFFAHYLILGILYNASSIVEAFKEAYPLVNFQGLITGEQLDLVALSFYFSVLGIYLISFAKNCALLGILPKAIADWLAKYVDIHKNIEKKNDE